MCLIVASRTGVLPDSELVERAWVTNNDGWGVTSVNGSMHCRKGFSLEGLQAALEVVKGSPYVAHMRWATHGHVSAKNCHPYRVKRGLHMAHNGVLSCVKVRDKARSDTYEFIHSIVRPMLRAYDGHIPVQELGKLIGSGNKLAFIDSAGEITLVNEGLGVWYNSDVWLSNSNSLPLQWNDPAFHGEAWEWDADPTDAECIVGGDVDCEVCGEVALQCHWNFQGYALCEECYREELAAYQYENDAAYRYEYSSGDWASKWVSHKSGEYEYM